MSTLTGGLEDLRNRVAAALAPGPGDTWSVHAFPVDAVEAPAYVLVWGDPWLEPATHCTQTARLDVVAIVGRLDEPAQDLDGLVAHAIAALITAGTPARRVARPGPYQLAGVQYHAARLTVTYPVFV